MSTRRNNPYDRPPQKPKPQKKRALLWGVLVFILIVIANLTGLFVGLEEDLEAEEAFPDLFTNEETIPSDYVSNAPGIMPQPQGISAQDWQKLWNEKDKEKSDHFKCRQSCCSIGDLMYEEAIDYGKLLDNRFCSTSPGTCDPAWIFKVEGPFDQNPNDDLLTIVFAYNRNRDNIVLISCWKSDDSQNCPAACNYQSRF